MLLMIRRLTFLITFISSVGIGQTITIQGKVIDPNDNLHGGIIKIYYAFNDNKLNADRLCLERI